MESQPQNPELRIIPENSHPCICPDKQILSIKLQLFSYPTIKTCVLGVQKNRLIETVLLRTQQHMFWL